MTEEFSKREMGQLVYGVHTFLIELRMLITPLIGKPVRLIKVQEGKETLKV